MRTLQFEVNEQSLTKAGDFSHIIRGTKGYLTCNFKLNGSDWNGCVGIAVFMVGKEEYAVKLDRYSNCNVPDEAANSKTFKIRLHGYRGTYSVVTNKVLVEQEG